MSLSRPSAEKHEKNEKTPTGRQSPDGDRPNMSDLRIVLLGKNLSGNIRVRNRILGKDMMETKFSKYYFKNQSVRISGMVENRKISLISCPLLLKLNLSDHQIREGVRDCVSMSAPGPHVFILVLQQQDFSKKDKHRVMDVLNCFSDQAIKRTILLTTDEDIHTSGRNNEFTQLISECGGGHLYFNEGQSGWCSEMLRRVDDILEKEPEEYLKCDIYEDAEAEGSAEEYSYHKDDGKPNKDEGGLFSSVGGKSNLNVVLCGADPGLKVNISRLLQRKTSQQEEFSSVCVKREQEIHGHPISVVELPSLTQLSEDEAMHESLHCVSLCDPGVHVFLIIIPVGPLTDKDKAEVEKILKMFYSSENFMMIFTTDVTVDRHVTDSLDSYAQCKNLISVCGGRYKVIGLKEHRKSKQIPELLDYIKDMKTEPYSLQMYVRAQEMRVRYEYEEKLSELQLKINSYGIKDEQDDLKHLRIVLIGRTGSGKSATGNTILGREQFQRKFGSKSATTVCEQGDGEVNGRSVAVVDTPDLFDTTLQKEQVLEEIMKCVSLSEPGPHAFIIVLSLGRLTQEESETVGLMKKIFGPKAAEFSIILFTNEDRLKGKSIDDYVKRSNSEDLKKLLKDCGDRYLAFNNNETQDRSQVTKLIKMIEEMKTTNQGQYFTNSMFEEAEMSIKKNIEKILKEKEREIQAEKDELKAKHEIEIENMKKGLEEEKRKADVERMKIENKCKEKEETLRKEFEEIEKTEEQKREKEKKKQIEEEKQQRDEYHQKIEEMKREIEQQRSQYEKREKEREEEDRKREEKEKMKHEHNQIIAELQKKQEDEIKKRDSDEQKRSEEEEREKQEWVRKIREAESDRKETREEIKRQLKEWEEDKKRQMREREEDDRKRRNRHEEELREKQEELEKTRKIFEKEKEEERQKQREERQKQRQEREQKEREYEEKKDEMMKHYEKLERERKEEWERKRREDDERREEEERKRWEKRNEDIKRAKEEEMRRIERERKDREREEREEMKHEHEQRIKEMKKKHEDEARKHAEELNELRERKDENIKELKQMLEERQKQHEVLEKLHQHLKEQKGEEIKQLQEEIEELKNKSWCVIM